MPKHLGIFVGCVVVVVSACTPAQGNCDAATDAGATPETSLQVLNLSGAPVRVAVGSEAPATLGGFEALKVVEKATSGLKDTLKTQVRLMAGDAGTQDASLETAVDLAAGESLVLVVTAGADGLATTPVSPRQTQGKTFGEKVAAGLQAAGSLARVDTDGDCLADVGAELGTPATVVIAESPSTLKDCPGARTFVRPASAGSDAVPFVVAVDGAPRVSWVAAEAPAGASGRRTSSPNVVTRGPLPEVYVLNAHESRLPTKVTAGAVTLVSDLAPARLARVPSDLVAQAAAEAENAPGRAHGGGFAGVVSAAVSSVGFSATPGVTGLLEGFAAGDVLLIAAEHPTAMRMGRENAPARGRRELLFASLLDAEATGCVGVSLADTECMMGAAVSVGSGIGGLSKPSGATSGSYAAGRLLPPSNVTDAVGVTPDLPFIYVDSVKRFDFSLPGDLVRQLAGHGGFFVVTSATALEATAPAGRALFWVDSSTSPWSLHAVRSR